MNIFQLITGNWLAGPQSQRFPNREAPAPAFRGHVEVDRSLCITCGICSEVCVSAAIEVIFGPEHGTWIYDPAFCTFCGSCVSHCPVDALTQADDRGSSYGRPGEQKVSVTVRYPTCERCGQQTLPHAERVVKKALPQAAEELRARARLCPDCRSRATAEGMKDALGGTSLEGHDGR